MGKRYAGFYLLGCVASAFAGVLAGGVSSGTDPMFSSMIHWPFFSSQNFIPKPDSPGGSGSSWWKAFSQCLLGHLEPSSWLGFQMIGLLNGNSWLNAKWDGSLIQLIEIVETQLLRLSLLASFSDLHWTGKFGCMLWCFSTLQRSATLLHTSFQQCSKELATTTSWHR